MRLPSQPPSISPRASIALDGLRLLAAAVVVVFHVTSQWDTNHPALHEALGKASHTAVVVFFVLSGYVIAFTTTASPGPRHYAVARLSRLYSMLAPALVLTALVETVVANGDAQLAARYVHQHSVLRYLLTAFFCNESGLLSAAPPLNSPLWSLSYEFWYYTLFGLWFYRGGIPRVGLWLALAALAAGPKILLMMPIWLCGVWAWQHRRTVVKAGRGRAWRAAGAWLLLAVVAAASLPAFPAAVGERPLYLASQFGTDWVVGALVGLALWCLPASSPEPADAVPRAPWVRTVAGLSFPLYVFHFPLIVLWRVAIGWHANSWVQMGQVLAGVVIVAGLLGILLEHLRPGWTQLVGRLVRLIPGPRVAKSK